MNQISHQVILVGKLCTYIPISIILYLVASTILHHFIALQVEVAYVFCAQQNRVLFQSTLYNTQIVLLLGRPVVIRGRN